MKLVLQIDPGETISEACQQAQTLCDACGHTVEFEFNSVLCIAEPNGTWENLAERQSQAQSAKLLVRSRANTITTVYCTGDSL